MNVMIKMKFGKVFQILMKMKAKMNLVDFIKLI